MLLPRRGFTTTVQGMRLLLLLRLLKLFWLLVLQLMSHAIDLLLIAAIEEVLHSKRPRGAGVATADSANAAADAHNAVVDAVTGSGSACVVARDLDYRRGTLRSTCFHGPCG